jgi:hypothetical protein
MCVHDYIYVCMIVRSRACVHAFMKRAYFPPAAQCRGIHPLSKGSARPSSLVGHAHGHGGHGCCHCHGHIYLLHTCIHLYIAHDYAKADNRPNGANCAGTESTVKFLCYVDIIFEYVSCGFACIRTCMRVCAGACMCMSSSACNE